MESAWIDWDTATQTTGRNGLLQIRVGLVGDAPIDETELASGLGKGDDVYSNLRVHLGDAGGTEALLAIAHEGGDVVEAIVGKESDAIPTEKFAKHLTISGIDSRVCGPKALVDLLNSAVEAAVEATREKGSESGEYLQKVIEYGRSTAPTTRT